LDTMVIDALPDLSRWGMALCTAFTVCIMSTRNVSPHVSLVSPTASALTLHTRQSTPPSTAADASTQPINASGSPTSKASPKAFEPYFDREATTASTSLLLRAHIDTFAPSEANPSAIA